jgi:hypothetical protein
MDYRRIYEAIDNLETMVDGYLTAVSFTGADLDEETAENLGIIETYNKSDPYLYDFDINDIDSSSVVRVRDDCESFIQKAGELLHGSNLPHGEPDWSLIGHNFWLSRNGHGSGFFDSEDEYGNAAQQLQDIARDFGESYAFVKMDGDIEIE